VIECLKRGFEIYGLAHVPLVLKLVVRHGSDLAIESLKLRQCTARAYFEYPKAYLANNEYKPATGSLLKRSCILLVLQLLAKSASALSRDRSIEITEIVVIWCAA
jgi:hypothetical protein